MSDVDPAKGTAQRQPDSTHVVSMWHIPGGCDYSNAYPINVFFSDEDAARMLFNRYNCCPEMAMLLTIEEHDRCKRPASQRTAETQMA